MSTLDDTGQFGRAQRRAWIPGGPLQRRFMRRVVFVPALSVVGLSILMVVLASRLLAEATAVETEIPSLVPFVALSFFTIVLGGVVLCWRAMRYGNSVLGPLPRIVAAIRDARAGRPRIIRVRSDDELYEMVEELNGLLAELGDGNRAPRPDSERVLPRPDGEREPVAAGAGLDVPGDHAP